MDLDTLMLTDLTVDEDKALRAYKTAQANDDGLSFCFDLNDNLESGLWPDEMKADIKAAVDSLDHVFDRCPKLTKNYTMYRGTGYASSLGPLKLGRRFRSLGFWSVTTTLDVAEKFVQSTDSQPNGLILVLNLHAGLPAYNMELLAGAGGSEREILLPRGLLWQIEKVEPYDVKLLPVPARESFKSVGQMTLRLMRESGRPLR